MKYFAFGCCCVLFAGPPILTTARADAPSNATGGEKKPRFAGWIKSVRGTVRLMASGTQRVEEFQPGQALYWRLYVGDRVQAGRGGETTLLVYGHPVVIKPSQTWYTLPSSESAPKSGQSVLDLFLVTAGQRRGEPLMEAAWRALFLESLHNPNPASRVRVGIRLVPVNVDTDPLDPVRLKGVRGDRTDLRWDHGVLQLQDQDFVMVEVSNQGRLPVSIALLDVGAAGSIAQLYPASAATASTSGDAFRLAPNARWTRLPYPHVFRLGPPFGRELFKVIATEIPINLSCLTATGIPQSQSPAGAGDASGGTLLTYLLGTSGCAVKPGDWNTAETRFNVIPRKPHGQ